MRIFPKIESEKMDQMLLEYRNETGWKSNIRSILLIILLSFGLSFLEYLSTESMSFIRYLSTLYYCFFCWFGASYLGIFCLYFFSRLEQTGIRTIIYLVLILVYVSIVVAFGRLLFDHGDTTFLEVYFSSTFITILISASFLAGDYFKMYKKKIEETERLKRLQMEKELKILNSQVNPHFLFNSLNTLMAIIPEEGKNALKFTESFSKVYRYTLLHKDHEVVNLAEELKLVEDYCFLLQIRFGENFHCLVDVPDELMEAVVPPFVLQLLVENATKHNAIGDESPLEIRIFEQDDRLVVQNNLNPKITEAEGTKTGLQNIQKRVEHLTGKSINIQQDEQFYKVTIPIIFAVDYESTDR